MQGLVPSHPTLHWSLWNRLNKRWDLYYSQGASSSHTTVKPFIMLPSLYLLGIVMPIYPCFYAICIHFWWDRILAIEYLLLNRPMASSLIEPPSWILDIWRPWKYMLGIVLYSMMWICCHWTIVIYIRVLDSPDTCQLQLMCLISSK